VNPGQAQAPIYEFGGFRLDAARRQLLLPDLQAASLSVRGFDILLYLVEHRGEVVEKSALMKAVWPNVVVEENNLNQNISVLRRALGERAGEHRFIMTVPGRGFRFVAPVSVRQPSAQSAQAAVPARSPRIAIMPFENLSPDPGNAFFADGLHDELIATLAQRAPGLQVISRTTMMGYRARRAPLPQIAAELAADYVMEGTVRREAEQVRVTLQLIDARDDRHIWAHTYDRTLRSALTLQGEVAADVAARLAARFMGESGTPPTSDPQAYDLYLQFRLQGRNLTPLSPVERYDECQELLDRAIGLDGNFAVAYANRAGFLAAKFGFNYDTSDALRARIRSDVATAKRLAPADPLAHAAEASYYFWVERDLQRALDAFRTAVAAGLADPLYLSSYGNLLERLRHDAEALQYLERALALDPGNPFLIMTTALGYLILRRAGEGIRLLDRAIEKFPEHRVLRLTRGQIKFLNLGLMDEVRSELALATRHLPLPSLLDANFRVMVCAGAYEELQKLLDAIPDRVMRVVPGPGGGGPLFGVGDRPIAQLRGWLALLRERPDEAARHGREVLEFIADRKITPQNSWFLHLLTADARTFLGEKAPAIVAARAALGDLSLARDRYGIYVTLSAAVILAWNGADDDAMTLIESVVEDTALSVRGLVLRNPALGQPLARNARFRKISASLEDGIKASLREGGN